MMTKEEKEKVQHLKLIIKEQRRQIDKLISDSKEPGKERYSKTRMVITGAAYLDMIFEKLSQYIDVCIFTSPDCNFEENTFAYFRQLADEILKIKFNLLAQKKCSETKTPLFNPADTFEFAGWLKKEHCDYQYASKVKRKIKKSDAFKIFIHNMVTVLNQVLESSRSTDESDYVKNIFFLFKINATFHILDLCYLRYRVCGTEHIFQDILCHKNEDYVEFAYDYDNSFECELPSILLKYEHKKISNDFWDTICKDTYISAFIHSGELNLVLQDIVNRLCPQSKEIDTLKFYKDYLEEIYAAYMSKEDSTKEAHRREFINRNLDSRSFDPWGVISNPFVGFQFQQLLKNRRPKVDRWFGCPLILLSYPLEKREDVEQRLDEYGTKYDKSIFEYLKVSYLSYQKSDPDPECDCSVPEDEKDNKSKSCSSVFSYNFDQYIKDFDIFCCKVRNSKDDKVDYYYFDTSCCTEIPEEKNKSACKERFLKRIRNMLLKKLKLDFLCEDESDSNPLRTGSGT